MRAAPVQWNSNRKDNNAGVSDYDYSETNLCGKNAVQQEDC